MICQLKNILEKQGRLQVWLQNELGVSKRTMHRWFNNETKIPTKHMYTIKHLLGLDSIEELYKEEE